MQTRLVPKAELQGTGVSSRQGQKTGDGVQSHCRSPARSPFLTTQRGCAQQHAHTSVYAVSRQQCNNQLCYMRIRAPSIEGVHVDVRRKRMTEFWLNSPISIIFVIIIQQIIKNQTKLIMYSSLECKQTNKSILQYKNANLSNICQSISSLCML